MDKDSQNKPTVAASTVVAIVTPLVSGANDLPPVATEDNNDTSEEPQKHFNKLKMSTMKFLKLCSTFVQCKYHNSYLLTKRRLKTRKRDIKKMKNAI